MALPSISQIPASQQLSGLRALVLNDCSLQWRQVRRGYNMSDDGVCGGFHQLEGIQTCISYIKWITSVHGQICHMARGPVYKH